MKLLKESMANISLKVSWYIRIVSDDEPIYNQGCYSRTGIALAENTQRFDVHDVTTCTSSCLKNKVPFSAVMVGANYFNTIRH